MVCSLSTIITAVEFDSYTLSLNQLVVTYQAATPVAQESLGCNTSPELGINPMDVDNCERVPVVTLIHILWQLGMPSTGVVNHGALLSALEMAP